MNERPLQAAALLAEAAAPLVLVALVSHSNHSLSREHPASTPGLCGDNREARLESM